jgi:hypothetical protein
MNEICRVKCNKCMVGIDRSWFYVQNGENSYLTNYGQNAYFWTF